MVTAERNRRLTEDRLKYYTPYPKQRAFHDAGAKHRERLFMAGNRVGKTLCGAAEMAMHLTGRYPEWWAGKRFSNSVRAWAAGVTSETTRDVVQEKLIGPPFRESERGSGMIPKDLILDVINARGVPGTMIRFPSGTSAATIRRCNSNPTSAAGRSGKASGSRFAGWMRNARSTCISRH